jgi:hypothetical protein
LPFYGSISHLVTSFRSLVSFSQEKEIPTIIGCDSNSNHVIWGNTNTNSKGAALIIGYIYGSHLNILNQGDESTFVTTIRHELIDITLLSSDIKRGGIIVGSPYYSFQNHIGSQKAL